MPMGMQPPVLPDPRQGMRKPGPSPAAAATGMNGFYGGIQNPGQGPAAMLGMGGAPQGIPPEVMQMMGGQGGPGGPAQGPQGGMGQPGMGPPPDQMPGQVQAGGVPQMTEADVFLRIVAEALGLIGGGMPGGGMPGPMGMGQEGGMGGGMPPEIMALMGGMNGGPR